MTRFKINLREAAACVSGLFAVAVTIGGVEFAGGIAEAQRMEDRFGGGGLEAFEVNDKG